MVNVFLLNLRSHRNSGCAHKAHDASSKADTRGSFWDFISP